MNACKVGGRKTSLPHKYFLRELRSLSLQIKVWEKWYKWHLSFMIRPLGYFCVLHPHAPNSRASISGVAGGPNCSSLPIWALDSLHWRILAASVNLLLPLVSPPLSLSLSLWWMLYLKLESCQMVWWSSIDRSRSVQILMTNIFQTKIVSRKSQFLH